MKKKIACLFLLMFCVITVLTGCNLFVTNYDLYLNQVVAQTSIEIDGSEKTFTITKEELINGYYSYGQSLTQEYGYTYEDALDYVLDMLLQRKVLLNHVTTLAEKEGELGAKNSNFKYQLNRNEYNEVVQECWDFVDEQLKTVEKDVKEEFDFSDDVFPEKEEKTSEYKAYAPYKTTINVKGNEVTKKKTIYVDEIKGDEPDADSLVLWDKDKKELSNYKKPSYANATVDRLVWSKYYTNLKNNEENKKIDDRSDEATFARELERVYKINLENKYLEKFQTLYEESVGFDAAGKLTNDVKQKIINKYTEAYNKNKEVYDISKTAFYKKVTSTTDRTNYVYYGEDEELYTCIHILVKLDQKTQIDKIKEIEADPQLTDEERQTKADQYRDVASTYATERDAEGFEIEGKKVSVEQILNELQTKIAEETATYAKGTNLYAETAIRIFNEYMYKYNQDTGIENAVFDYVVGSKTSPMVQSFTDAVRNLHDNEGYVGAMSGAVLEENDNYSGFHIVMYTGTLENTVNPQTLTVDNVVEKLSAIKTSQSHNQTMFEYYYDLVVAEEKDYNTFETNTVSSLLGGVEIKYYRYLYSDLLA